MKAQLCFATASAQPTEKVLDMHLMLISGIAHELGYTALQTETSGPYQDAQEEQERIVDLYCEHNVFGLLFGC